MGLESLREIMKKKRSTQVKSKQKPTNSNATMKVQQKTPDTKQNTKNPPSKKKTEWKEILARKSKQVFEEIKKELFSNGFDLHESRSNKGKSSKCPSMRNIVAALKPLPAMSSRSADKNTQTSDSLLPAAVDTKNDKDTSIKSSGIFPTDTEKAQNLKMAVISQNGNPSNPKKQETPSGSRRKSVPTSGATTASSTTCSSALSELPKESSARKQNTMKKGRKKTVSISEATTASSTTCSTAPSELPKAKESSARKQDTMKKGRKKTVSISEASTGSLSSRNGSTPRRGSKKNRRKRKRSNGRRVSRSKKSGSHRKSSTGSTSARSSMSGGSSGARTHRGSRKQRTSNHRSDMKSTGEKSHTRKTSHPSDQRVRKGVKSTTEEESSFNDESRLEKSSRTSPTRKDKMTKSNLSNTEGTVIKGGILKKQKSTPTKKHTDQSKMRGPDSDVSTSGEPAKKMHTTTSASETSGPEARRMSRKSRSPTKGSRESTNSRSSRSRDSASSRGHRGRMTPRTSTPSSDKRATGNKSHSRKASQPIARGSKVGVKSTTEEEEPSGVKDKSRSGKSAPTPKISTPSKNVPTKMLQDQFKISGRDTDGSTSKSGPDGTGYTTTSASGISAEPESKITVPDFKSSRTSTPSEVRNGSEKRGSHLKGLNRGDSGKGPKEHTSSRSTPGGDSLSQADSRSTVPGSKLSEKDQGQGHLKSGSKSKLEKSPVENRPDSAQNESSLKTKPNEKHGSKTAIVSSSFQKPDKGETGISKTLSSKPSKEAHASTDEKGNSKKIMERVDSKQISNSKESTEARKSSESKLHKITSKEMDGTKAENEQASELKVNNLTTGPIPSTATKIPKAPPVPDIKPVRSKEKVPPDGNIKSSSVGKSDHKSDPPKPKDGDSKEKRTPVDGSKPVNKNAPISASKTKLRSSNSTQAINTQDLKGKMAPAGSPKTEQQGRLGRTASLEGKRSGSKPSSGSSPSKEKIISDRTHRNNTEVRRTESDCLRSKTCVADKNLKHCKSAEVLRFRKENLDSVGRQHIKTTVIPAAETQAGGPRKKSGSKQKVKKTSSVDGPPTGCDVVLECTHCYERMVQQKLLPCAHSFCLRCLQEIIGEGQTVSCPWCQAEHPVPAGGADGFHPNGYLERVLRLRRGALRSDSGNKQPRLFYCANSNLQISSSCVPKNHDDHKVTEYLDELRDVVRNMQSVASQCRELCNVVTAHLHKLDKLGRRNKDMTRVALKQMEKTRRELVDADDKMLSEKAKNKLQHDKDKVLRVEQSNSEKIGRVRAVLAEGRVLLNGFVADIDTSFRRMSEAELIHNHANVTETFLDLTGRLLDESLDLDVEISNIQYQKPEVRMIKGKKTVVSNGKLDLGTIHIPTPVKIRRLKVSAQGSVPIVRKIDSTKTGNQPQYTKMCISEDGNLVMFGNNDGKRTIQCKPTISTSLWEQDMKDLTVCQLCAVKGKREYLVCIIEKPKSIQLRNMKTGELLFTLRITFTPGNMCSPKPNVILVVDKTEKKKEKLVEFRINEEIVDKGVLTVKLEAGEKTLDISMDTCIQGLAIIKHSGRLLVAMATRMNDVVQAIDYNNGEVVWENNSLCDGVKTESIDLCQDNVGFLYITDKLCKRVMWMPANGKMKKKLVGIPSVSNVSCAAWDRSQQRLLLLTTDHRSEEWLKAYRVSYVNPSTRLKDSTVVD